MSALGEIHRLRDQIAQLVVGQPALVDRIILALLSNGNLLIEGLPGLAKTRAVKALSSNLDVDLSRIQFTPDLLPADITGTEVYYASESGGEFRYQPGPIFSNIILADEVNRAPAKVQAALLEAMEERQVTVAGTTHPLPALFMVLATQNPIDHEGTYPLPQAQLDRFMMHVEVGYLSPDDELRMIDLVRRETENPDVMVAASPVSKESIFAARKEIDGVKSAEAIDRYLVDLVFASRDPAAYSKDLAAWISLGASPRAGIQLDRGARARAWLDGRDYTTPEDVRAIAHDVLRHRITPSYEASAEAITTNRIIDELLKLVAVP